ncbi:MAG: hypothetical protein GEU99_13850 [Luteitalea sp.]|nr:hypothetical protein [Luteitalea sp.]
MRRADSPITSWTTHALNSGSIYATTYRSVRILPRAVSYGIGHASTFLAWQLMRATTDALVDNLRAIFPTASDAVLRRQALATYRSYACDVIDFIRSLRLSREAARELFVFDNRETVDALLHAGRGMLLVSAHHGNWEMGGILLRRAYDYPLSVLAMTEASPEANRLRDTIRRELGIDTISVRQSMDTALQIRRKLSEGQLVALLVDRHVGRDSVPVTLFGRQAFFLRTPALMAYLSGAPLVPVSIERRDDGRFLVHLSAPIFVGRDGDREALVQEATQRVADAIEARVRARPDLWYHFYRYWDA